MITQYEVYNLLSAEIPPLSCMEYPSKSHLKIYASINYFTDYTMVAINQHNISQLKKCFSVAEKLYMNGDSLVKLLIRKNFIYSLLSLGSITDIDKEMIKKMIPKAISKN